MHFFSAMPGYDIMPDSSTYAQVLLNLQFKMHFVLFFPLNMTFTCTRTEGDKRKVPDLILSSDIIVMQINDGVWIWPVSTMSK